MPDVKKITILKTDEPAAVAEKLMDTEAEEIVLSIPKFSKFSESISNFKLIKKQAQLLGRVVRVESVDEDAVALAKKAGLEAINPFFGRAVKSQKQFSDIVVKKPVRTIAAKAAPAAPRLVPKSEPEPEPEAESIQEQVVQETEAAPVAREIEKPVRITGLGTLNEMPRSRRVMGQIFRVRTAILILAGILLFGVVPYVGLAVLPKAEITLTMQKEDWEFKNAVVADKSITTIDNSANRIPGQVFIQKTNVSSKFPATGKKNIERKATGSITIYNAFSSAPQSLVANTRFMTPDNKVFRLVEAVIVPGAKIESGKIAPSSIVASVVADKPGEAYNIAPVSKFTIPGFSGTAKYEGFYAESKAAFTGGYIGEAKVATEADIDAAKKKSVESLEASLRTLLAAQMPADFTVLDDGSVFTLLKQTVTPEAGADGQFTVLSEGQISLIAFREKDLLDFLRSRAMSEKGSGYEIIAEQKEYGVSKVDAGAGRVSFSVTYKATLRRSLDMIGFMSQIIGKTEDELKTIIAGVPGISGGTAKLWPFYVRTVTKDAAKVKVTVE